jgi:hypothetical protein
MGLRTAVALLGNFPLVLLATIGQAIAWYVFLWLRDF